MSFQRFPKQMLIKMYKKMMQIRKFEDKVGQLYARGIPLGLVHLYIGQEAVAVGAIANLRKDDYVTSTHRGHGHFIAKVGDMKELMAELFGKETGCCKGRGGTMHIADVSAGMLGSTGIVGAGIPIAGGAGLAINLRGTNQVVVCFFSEGASNTGVFHEGLNLAALWKLPVVYVCENNQYAISVHVSKSTSVKDIATRAAAYGIPGVVVDGMDVIAVYEAVRDAVKRAREGRGPTLIECKTYRFRSHGEGDPTKGTEYRSKEEIEDWETKCPIKNLKNKLIEANVLTEHEIQCIETECADAVQEAYKFATESPDPDPSMVLENLYAPSSLETIALPSRAGNRLITSVEAMLEGLREEMRRDETIILLGTDVEVKGGIYARAPRFREEFGERVRDTPISEAAIIGASIGAAQIGMKAVANLHYQDFLGCCMDQIFNQLAKMRYAFGGQVKLPVVVIAVGGSRYPIASSGPHHSQCLESWFMHVPGLKVVVPSTPFDAKGLIKAAIRDGNPVMYFYHSLTHYGGRISKLQKLYPRLLEHVPREEYVIPLGIADVKRRGEDVTIVATQLMVHKALAAAEELDKRGIDAEVIDPRTLVPFDKGKVIDSVQKTGRVVIASEDCKTSGVGAEIAAIIIEEAFDYLDAPIKRVATLDVPTPFSATLEKAVIPSEEDIISAVCDIC